jgi:hypothetical protein
MNVTTGRRYRWPLNTTREDAAKTISEDVYETMVQHQQVVTSIVMLIVRRDLFIERHSRSCKSRRQRSMSCSVKFNIACTAKLDLTPPVLPIYDDETCHRYK